MTVFRVKYWDKTLTALPFCTEDFRNIIWWEILKKNGNVKFVSVTITLVLQCLVKFEQEMKVRGLLRLLIQQDL